MQGPGAYGLFTQLIVGGSGEFVYNAALTQLQSSNAGQATTDPILGVAVPQGFATYNSAGFVINLLSTISNAFFQYNDAGASQGGLILSVSSKSGFDPVSSTHFPAGLYGIDPFFGDTLTVVGANIAFGQVPYTRPGQVIALGGGGAGTPALFLNAPEQGQALHLQMQMQGESPDGTTPPQLLIGPVSGNTNLVAQTPDMLEVQGGTSQTVAGLVTDVAGTLALTVRASAAVDPAWTVRGDGRVGWGPTSTVNDTFAERFGVAILRITRVLQLVEGAAPATPTGSGDIYVDATGHLHYLGPSGTDTILANP